MKHTLSSIILVLIGFAVNAQSMLKGKVTDAGSNMPLAGATISSAGNKSATTDKDGNFTIDCNKANEITVTFVGYGSFKYSVKNCNNELNVSLTSSAPTLNDVLITATSNTNKSVLYQPASITKLSPTELKRGTGLFLDDAINGNVPGVTMNRRAVSSGQQFNIRGYGNGSRGTRGVSSNFDGQGYKVYLNGIPITDAEGITTLDDIDFGSIGNVEVTKGPAGTLYGFAIAGVVNLKTIKPQKGKTSIGQEVSMGNYGLKRYTTQFQTAGEHSSVLINYGHQKSDGFTIHNASHKDFINAVAEFQPSEKQAVTAYFGYSNSYDQRSGELTIGQYDTMNYTGNIEYIKRDGHSQVYTARAGVGHTYMFNEHIANTTTVFATAFNSNASSAGGWTDKSTTNFGVRSTFDTKFSFKNNVKLSGITGVETQRQNAQTVGYTMVKNPLDQNPVWAYGNPYYWVIGASTSNVYSVSTTTSAFTEWTLALPKDLSITAGAGMSNMGITLDDRFYESTKPNKPTHYEKSYNGLVSPHVAINKIINKQVSVYASYSKAYKAPVSSYFYIPYVIAGTPAAPIAGTGVVNTTLKPEIGNQFEIGTKGELLKGNLSYELAIFKADFSDKMTAVAVPLTGSTTTTAFTYMVNGGKQDHKGIEALVKYTVYRSATGFIQTVRPFANITYSDFKYKNFSIQKTILASGLEDYSGKAVAGVAKVMANVGLDLGMKYGLYANINYLYKDGMPITSDGVYNTSSYSLLNAKLGFQQAISSHFDLGAYFGVNNINGTKYPIMVFVNQIPDAYIAAPVKANTYGGISLKYNF